MPSFFLGVLKISAWIERRVSSEAVRDRLQHAKFQHLSYRLGHIYIPFYYRFLWHFGGIANLVGGFWHMFFFPFHIWDVILPIDFHIFQDGYCTTNQK